MKRRIWMKLLALVQICVLVAFADGVIAFRHIHVIDGERIVHSHPYVPSSNHSHSQTAACSLAMLTVFNAEASAGCMLDAPRFIFAGTVDSVYQVFTPYLSFWSYFQRPPPVQG